MLPDHYSQPWLAPLNYEFLIHFYRVWPFSSWRISIAENLIFNPWLSTFPFALSYYLSWKEASKGLASTLNAQTRLLGVVVACIIGTIVTILLRPVVSWPAPAREPEFQFLYPPYYRGFGNEDCFPSHSTLIYMIVAMGLLPVHRRLAKALIAFVLVGIALPRIYLGGHYPIDVIASIVLAIASCLAVQVLGAMPRVQALLNWAATRGIWTECAIFFWSFELGSGFRGTLATITMLRHLPRLL
jgi:membrane-associated phospholipid phosphatase